MAIPVYVVTGFLDAGKTTFLNGLLNRRDWRDTSVLVIQFESGEEEFLCRYKSRECLTLSKRELERQPETIAGEISSCLHKTVPDEIWIEWNGVVPLLQLQKLLLDPSLRDLCELQRVLHMADAGRIEGLLGRTGAALPEQIAESDVIAVRGAETRAELGRIRHLLRGINPGVKVCGAGQYRELSDQLFGRKEHPVNGFLLGVVFLVALFYIIGPLSASLRSEANTVMNYFLGMILQAIPFLLIGVLLSSAIQIFVPRDAIERRFPKSLGLGMLAAIVGGFCLPVCDCASIPVFRSFVKKGIPLPVAVTFMAVTPVINPVVILSTYYAFGYDLSFALRRVCFGILVAVITGLTFAVKPPKGEILAGGTLDRVMCSCGCYEDTGAVTTFREKLGLYVRHSQAEFLSVGKYLVIGCFVSAVFQTVGTGVFTTAQSGEGEAVSILVMMAMAFVLSLCSSSDAVVARSLSSQFATSAVMGFLVFGPMMDIKNVLMLSSGFSKRFIVRLAITVAVVCFVSVFLLSGWGGL